MYNISGLRVSDYICMVIREDKVGYSNLVNL